MPQGALDRKQNTIRSVHRPASRHWPGTCSPVRDMTPDETPAIERKLAGLSDAADMLRVLDVEVALQRAKRLHGGGSLQVLRVAAIAGFLLLLIAALGGMSYLQGKLAERGVSGHRADVTASPTPAPSAPAAATRARPAGSAY